MFRFETLDIWNLAIEYCDIIFDIADDFPQKAQYNLGSQLRNSSLSISNNIAEGSGSCSKQEFKNFLNYSIRSLYETISGLFMAKRKKYINEQKFNVLYSKGEILVKKIRAFRESLN